MVSRSIQNIEQAQAQKEKAQAPIYARMEANAQKDQERVDKAAENYKPIEAPPPAPKPPENDPLSAFASPASIFAMLASAFTHTPAINAMNGMAGAINAAKQNDWKAYDTAYKQWEDNTKLAIEHHRLQAEDMKNALDMMQTNLAAGAAMAKAVAAQSDDRIATTLLETGQYEKLAQVQMERQRTAAAMSEASIRVKELNMQLQDRRDKQELAKQYAAAPDDATKQAILQKSIQMEEIKNPEFAERVTQDRALAGQRANEKNQIVTDPTTNKQYVFNPVTHQATTLDGQPYTPGGLEKIGKGQPSASGAAEKDAETLANWEFEQKNKRPPGPADEAEMAKLRVKQRLDDKGVIDDQTAEVIAKRVVETGDEKAMTGLARNAANVAKANQFIARIMREEGKTPADITAKVVQLAGLMAAERTTDIRGSNIGVGLLETDVFDPQVRDASKKVDRTRFPTVNSLEMAAARGTGGEDVVQLVIAVNAMKNAYATVLKRGGAATDDANRRADEVINAAWSDGQINAALDQIHIEAMGAEKAVGNQRENLRRQLLGQPPILSNKTDSPKNNDNQGGWSIQRVQ
jgi:hypothetical protein